MEREQMVGAIASVIEADRRKRGPKRAPEVVAEEIMQAVFPPLEALTEADVTIMKTCSHPTRIKVLRLLTNSDEPLTPTKMAEQLEMSLGSVSYHVREMAEREIIVLDHAEPVRGALAHYYKLTTLGARASELVHSGYGSLSVAA